MTGSMGRFEHGGDIYAHKGVIDFSANINPLGMPAAVVEALRDAMPSYDAYPDHESRELRAAIARAEGVDPDQVICTAGASDLMQRICLALRPRAALVTAPCFSGYEQALEQAGAHIYRHVLREEDGYNVTESILGFSKRTAGDSDGDGVPPDLVFICNPNNPTGLSVRAELVESIVAEAHAAGIVVVVDECFLDFTAEPSALPLIDAYPNLVVMRAFTKLYAMAGLRLGYGICSDAHFLAQLKDAGQLWAVSTPAQVAGVAALGVAGWAERTRAYVDEQRECLARGLADCGMEVLPGVANYLAFRSPIKLYEPLLERGFLIRRCENYEGLDSRWYRVAVRTAEENAALLAALKEVCS